jgi:hypothetical protein
MRKVEVQHRNTQNQSPAQQSDQGLAIASPHGEQIAQLEAMVKASPQLGKLTHVATMANNSPQATAQRRMMNMIRNSPRMAAQRKAAATLHKSPHVTVQRQQPGTGTTTQREEVEEPLQPKVAQREEAPAKPNHTGLPDNLKSGIESLSGMSMDNVRVHYNSAQPAQLNALAYAQGTDIHVAPGQEQHLPHEAWHVVQQAQGRVRPTMQMKDGMSVNDDAGLEREADVMGAKAIQYAGVLTKTIKEGGYAQPKVDTVQNKTMQFLRMVTHPEVNFNFDGAGTKINPPGGGATNPIGRSAWPNLMITANLITHANNTAIYQSGHQIAHRFGGADDGDNVAAWPDNQEASHSLEENRIDQGPALNRVNEHGKLKVTTGFYDANTVLPLMINQCLDTMRAHFQNVGNWDNLNSNSANLHPAMAPTDDQLYTALEARFNTQQYQVTDRHVASSVALNYEARVGANINQARSFNYSNYGIDLPDWSNNQAHWLPYLLLNKPRVIIGNENFQLER